MDQPTAAFLADFLARFAVPSVDEAGRQALAFAKAVLGWTKHPVEAGEEGSETTVAQAGAALSEGAPDLARRAAEDTHVAEMLTRLVKPQLAVVSCRWPEPDLGRGAAQPEPLFLLEKTGSGRRCIIPKGEVETDEAAFGAAAREAWEDAGVSGRLVGDEPFTSFQLVQKWTEHRRIPLLVLTFLMEVTQQRTRKEPVLEWTTRERATELFRLNREDREVDRGALVRVINAAHERIMAA